jgi:hypothetical protein
MSKWIIAACNAYPATAARITDSNSRVSLDQLEREEGVQLDHPP